MSGENEKASRWLRVAVVGSVGLKLRVDLVTILVRMIANGPDGKGIKRIFPKPNPISLSIAFTGLPSFHSLSTLSQMTATSLMDTVLEEPDLLAILDATLFVSKRRNPKPLPTITSTTSPAPSIAGSIRRRRRTAR